LTSAFKQHHLYGETTWVILGQVASAVILLISVRLFTDALEPAAYGTLALCTTAITLLTQTLMGPLSSAALRYHSAAAERGEVTALRNALDHLCRLVVAVFLAVCLIVALLLPWTLALLVGVTTGAAVMAGKNSVLLAILTASRDRRTVAIHQIADTGLRLLAGFTLLKTSHLGVAGVLLGQCIGSALVWISLVRSLKNASLSTKRSQDARPWEQQIVAYAWPMAISGVTSWAFFASQRWALNMFEDTASVGYFAVAFQIGYVPISMAGGALSTLIMPIYFSMAGDSSCKYRTTQAVQGVLQICGLTAVSVVALTCMCSLFAETVFRLLAREAYQPAVPLLPLAVAAAGILQISLLLSAVIHIHNKTTLLIPLNTIGNGAVVLLTFGAAGLWGVEGVFGAMLLGAVVHLAWNYHTVRLARQNPTCVLAH
jgi:O-antigen/teichoic acid export membrane protein